MLSEPWPPRYMTWPSFTVSLEKKKELDAHETVGCSGRGETYGQSGEREYLAARLHCSGGVFA